MKKVILIALAIIVLNFFVSDGDERVTTTTSAVHVIGKEMGSEQEPYWITVQDQQGLAERVTVDPNVWNLIEPNTQYLVNYTQEGEEPAVLTSIEKVPVPQQ